MLWCSRYIAIENARVLCLHLLYSFRSLTIIVAFLSWILDAAALNRCLELQLKAMKVSFSLYSFLYLFPGLCFLAVDEHFLTIQSSEYFWILNILYSLYSLHFKVQMPLFCCSCKRCYFLVHLSVQSAQLN